MIHMIYTDKWKTDPSLNPFNAGKVHKHSKSPWPMLVFFRVRRQVMYIAFVLRRVTALEILELALVLVHQR